MTVPTSASFAETSVLAQQITIAYVSAKASVVVLIAVAVVAALAVVAVGVLVSHDRRTWRRGS